MTAKVISMFWGFTLGGVAKYAEIISEAPKLVDIELRNLVIYCPRWNIDLHALEKINADTIVIGSRLDPSWIWKLAKYLDVARPDVVMTHGFNAHFILYLSGLFSHYNIKRVASYHGPYHASTFGRRLAESSLNRFTDYYLRKHADAVVSVAAFTKNYLVSKGVDPDRVTVIHNGIEREPRVTMEIAELRKMWGVGKKDIVIGTVSRLEPIKGLEFLIKALHKIAADNPRVKLVIVGTGMLEEELRQQVERLGLANRVVFAGYRSDVDNCLAAFDIFALPSLSECHSIALLEAMRIGKTIVATNVGGNTESVRHSKEALVVPPANSDVLAESLTLLIKNPDLSSELGRNAKVRFEQQFTTEKMLKAVAAWFAALCSVSLATVDSK